jgi:hypothetical protein
MSATVSGDITKVDDVRDVFLQASVPIEGSIQGAIVLRVRYSLSISPPFHIAPNNANRV